MKLLKQCHLFRSARKSKQLVFSIFYGPIEKQRKGCHVLATVINLSVVVITIEATFSKTKQKLPTVLKGALY